MVTKSVKAKVKKKIITKLVFRKIFFQEYGQVSIAMFYITQAKSKSP